MAQAIAGEIASYLVAEFLISEAVATVIGYAIVYAGAAVVAQQLLAGSQNDWDTMMRNRNALVNTADAVTPIKVIYGTRRVGGARVFTSVTGLSKEYLNIVVVWCEGEVDAIEQIYLDDVPITDSRFSGVVYYENFRGAPDQPVCASLQDQVNYYVEPDFGTKVPLATPVWTASHRGVGLCYTYFRLEWKSDRWQGLPAFTADIRGLKVYDPRTRTTGYSNNMALCVRDYLTNNIYGRGVSDGDLLGSGTAQAGAAASLTLAAGASSVNDEYKGERLWLVSGAGSLQERGISAYDGTTKVATVYPRWRTNGVRNSNANNGSVIGSPGSLPTIWTAAGTGLSTEVVGRGELLGKKYVDLRIFGTAGATFFNITFETISQLAALNGETWGASVQIAVVGGSLANITDVRMRCALGSSAPAYIGELPGHTNIVSQLNSRFQRATILGTVNNASTAWIWPYFQIAWPSAGAAIEVTLRFAEPQIEKASDIGDYIETSGSRLTLPDNTSGYELREPSEIDDESFKRAADICDTTFDVPNGSGGTTQIARYTCEGVIDIDQSSLDAAQALLSAARATLTWSAGKYKLRVAAADDDTGFRFTTDNIIGEWRISLPGKRTLFNRCRARYFDPTQDWQAVIQTYDSPTYRQEDNNLLLDREVPLPFTSNAYRALMLAQLEVQLSRAGTLVTFLATQEALRCEVGDVVGITHETPGWTDRLFRITALEIQADDNVKVSCIDYNAAAYDITTAQYIASAPGTILPDPFSAVAPSDVALESGTNSLYIAADGTVKSRIHITWSPSLYDRFVTDQGTIEVQYKKSADSEWLNAPSVNGSAVETYITDVQDGVSYDVRVRSTNGMVGSSEWVTISGHVVIGKTEAPSDVAVLSVTGTRLSWTPVADKDLAGYRIRIISGTEVDWGSGAPMHEGLITETPYDMLIVPVGSAVVMIKAVDTSGNESANATYVGGTFTGPEIQNEAAVYDAKAAGFPGDITDGSLSGGNLVADSTTLMWKANSAANMWSMDSGLLMWQPAIYTSMEYVETVTFFDVIPNSRLIIDAVVIGDPWKIEYRVSSSVPMWGDSGAFMWSSDSNPLWAVGEWVSWPGSITIDPTAYDFRITTGAGATQGKVTDLKFITDAVTLEDDLNDVVISAAGTRLPIVSDFRAINTVLLTLQDDGGNAVSSKVLDKDTDLGPLVQCFNVSGTAVDGMVDAKVKGY